jgi:hypothetical protein
MFAAFQMRPELTDHGMALARPSSRHHCSAVMVLARSLAARAVEAGLLMAPRRCPLGSSDLALCQVNAGGLRSLYPCYCPVIPVQGKGKPSKGSV